MVDERAIHAVVRGLVQGVGFRYSTRREAARLGVTGWVRNQPDGAVEVLAQGPAAAVAELVAYLETGPSHARVASVSVTEVEPQPGRIRFEIGF